VQWVFILQEYDFQVVHHASLVTQDVNGLNQNPCTSQHNSIGVRWIGETNEKWC
jgi:hypothetical protein